MYVQVYVQYWTLLRVFMVAKITLNAIFNIVQNRAIQDFLNVCKLTLNVTKLLYSFHLTSVEIWVGNNRNKTKKRINRLVFN